MFCSKIFHTNKTEFHRPDAENYYYILTTKKFCGRAVFGSTPGSGSRPFSRIEASTKIKEEIKNYRKVIN